MTPLFKKSNVVQHIQKDDMLGMQNNAMSSITCCQVIIKRLDVREVSCNSKWQEMDIIKKALNITLPKHCSKEMILKCQDWL